MKIYAIAYTESHCFGHGDYRKVTCIYFNSENNPQIFTSKEKAEKYINEKKLFGCFPIEVILT